MRALGSGVRTLATTLIDAGQNVIKEAIGYDAPFAERIRGAVRRWPTFFYLSTIALATCGIFAAVLARSAGPTPTARQFAIVLMIALIPVMEMRDRGDEFAGDAFAQTGRLPAWISPL